ncbi:MAG TPA: hypothetical protein VIM70_05600 [Clostridium sp.]|uniref:hypothetical protein n=1 Tax=Clostridium sp. TaxID=1506 RepID=UPI002F930F3C
MNSNKLSSINMLKILGCFAFDIALILGFLKTFGLFLIIAPGKSVLILIVLLLGLLILNVVVVFSDMLFISIGIPYSAVTVTLAVLYVIVSNILSIFLIPGSIIWYIVWQLIIFAVFILIFAVIVAFINAAAKDIVKVENEQADKTSIMLQLMEIEDAFIAKEDQEALLHCLNLFKALKERIHASTPFGRIVGNSVVLKAENQINNNLVSMKISLKENLTNENLVELQKLIEDSLRLVIYRETLNIK